MLDFFSMGQWLSLPTVFLTSISPLPQAKVTHRPGNQGQGFLFQVDSGASKGAQNSMAGDTRQLRKDWVVWQRRERMRKFLKKSLSFLALRNCLLRHSLTSLISFSAYCLKATRYVGSALLCTLKQRINTLFNEATLFLSLILGRAWESEFSFRNLYSFVPYDPYFLYAGSQ